MDEIPGDPGGCSRPHPPERRGPLAGAERDGRRTPGRLQRAVQSLLRGDHHCGAPERLGRLVDRPVSYTDVVIFAVMTARRCRTALSFDRHFQIAGFELWRSG